MTVKELIHALEKEDPNRLVVCQKDSEGNGFSPLYECWSGTYLPRNKWDGDARPEYIQGGSAPEKTTGRKAPKVCKALILVPMN
jgi:hypothetical protein